MYVYVLYVMVSIGRYLCVFAFIVHMVCIVCIERYWSVLECTLCVSKYYHDIFVCTYTVCIGMYLYILISICIYTILACTVCIGIQYMQYVFYVLTGISLY